MRVHGPKRLTAVAWPAEQVTGLPLALMQLQHWARVTPLRNALRHMRDGQWHAWRWIDALRDVERVADGLRQWGFGGQSRLVLSGAFEPHMLLLALAAQALGGQVLTLADDLPAAPLHQQLWRIRPSHAYVPGAQALAAWRALHASSVAPRWLFSEQEAPPANVLAFDQLLGPAQRLGHWWQALDKPALWSTQGTGGPGALAAVLQQWLGTGQSLALGPPGEHGVVIHDWLLSLARTLTSR
ncbi:hypothetical protein ACW9H6_01100 [Pseudomonas sp. SDO528_S397]